MIAAGVVSAVKIGSLRVMALVTGVTRTLVVECHGNSHLDLSPSISLTGGGYWMEISWREHARLTDMLYI